MLSLGSPATSPDLLLLSHAPAVDSSCAPRPGAGAARGPPTLQLPGAALQRLLSHQGTCKTLILAEQSTPFTKHPSCLWLCHATWCFFPSPWQGCAPNPDPNPNPGQWPCRETPAGLPELGSPWEPAAGNGGERSSACKAGRLHHSLSRCKAPPAGRQGVTRGAGCPDPISGSSVALQLSEHRQGWMCPVL